MTCEIIGICPSCVNGKDSRMIDIYVGRNDKGDVTDIYIFGDDDFDVPANNQSVTDITVSEDGKTITEIICPRCKERISVNIPVIKEPRKETKNAEKISQNADLNVKQKS